MARDNGGIIGVTNNPTSSTATGVWSIESQYQARVGDTWPERTLFTTKSARFNSASTDSLDRTPSSSGSGTTFTMSMWLKRSGLGGTHLVYKAKGSGQTEFTLAFNSDKLQVYQVNSGGGQEAAIKTLAVQRDTSAWYHACIQIQTSVGTATDRCKIYINGVQQTIDSSGTDTYSSGFNTGVNQASYKQEIGGAASPYGGYMAEFIMIDGSILAPTSFGVANSDGVWTPIPYTGTFGTNGFNLQFENAAALGTDTSPNGNTFTVNNLTSVDQATDYPEVNFCTWNSLDNFYSSATFSEGNTTVVTPNASLTYATSTIGLSNGRWYFEVQPFDPSDNNNIGIVDHVSTSNSSNAGELQFQPRGWCYRQAGDVYNNNSSVSGSWAAYSAGVTIGVFVDLVDNKIYWSRNGVMQNSGTGVSITAAASTDTGFYFPAVGDYVTNDDTTFKTNFGGSSSFTISSGVTDDNGYGTFEYTPNVTVDSTAKKFYSINTANLAEFG